MKPLLIVDGYNVIGAWSEVKRRGWDINESRDRLLHLLEDHAGYTEEEIILVFDGYMSDRRLTTEEKHGSVTLVFTKHAETADSYIEYLVAHTPKYRSVRVATSDGLEQSQVLSTGAVRLTSRELLIELQHTRSRGMSFHRNDILGKEHRPLSSRLNEDTLAQLEKMRREDL